MSFIRRMFGQQKASETGGLVSMFNLGRPVWTPRRYDRLADESYIQNAIAFRCVRLIATNVAAVPWKLFDRTGQEVEDHPALTLVRNPAPGFWGQSFAEQVIGFLILAGNSYIEAVGPENGAPRELWALRPDRMRVIAGSRGLPSGYEYEVNGQKTRWDADPLTGQSDILHLKEFHPLNDWYGLSRVEAAALSIDAHNAISSHAKALLDNGARPSGALVFKPSKGQDGREVVAPQSFLDKALEALTERHGGAQNAGKPMVFSGNVTWENMGQSPRDMDFNTGKLEVAREICTAFGVPHMLLIPGQSTFNNVSEAKLELMEQTVTPIVNLLVDAFNNWLLPRFGDGLEFRPDWDSVSALEPRREVRRETAVTLFDKGLLTSEEARDMLGREPLPADAERRATPEEIKILLAAVQAGELSRVAFLEEMKRRGVLSESFDPATDEELLGEEQGTDGNG